MPKTTVSVSVIILTYEPDPERLKNTINSIIVQQGVTYEVIISDDGSKRPCTDLVETLMQENGFMAYRLIGTEENSGTVKNVLRGLMAAKGEYVKLISPGDMLYDENTLAGWTRELKNSGCSLGFSKCLYYNAESGEPHFVNEHEVPRITEIYRKESYSKKAVLLNYLLLRDVPVGAAFLCRRDLLEQYLKLLGTSVKYSEDMAYRLMISDGLAMHYYAEPSVFYEYGAGISTRKKKKWEDILLIEKQAADHIIVSRIKSESSLDRRLKKTIPLIGTKEDWKKYLVIPELIGWKIRKSFSGRIREDRGGALKRLRNIMDMKGNE